LPSWRDIADMATPTTTARAIERLLARPLKDYLAESRQAGMSWAGIAYDIYDRTGLGLTSQTVRNWADRAGIK